MSRRWQRRLWFKSLTALFGVWFVLATTEVTSLHACPMHDGPMHGVTMDMAGMSAMHGHSVHSMHAEHAGSRTDDQSPPHACTCISACCAATPTSLPAMPALVALLVKLVPGEIQPAVLGSVEPRVLWIDFVLPFANAPPMIARA